MYMSQSVADAINEAAARQADRARLMVLRMLETGLTQSEIARRIGVSRQRVSQIVQRAKARGLLP